MSLVPVPVVFIARQRAGGWGHRHQDRPRPPSAGRVAFLPYRQGWGLRA